MKTMNRTDLIVFLLTIIAVVGTVDVLGATAGVAVLVVTAIAW